MKKPLIFNIQKFSVHDGNGIRTTVFFKGCPLSCLWCHNPESQAYGGELLLQNGRCTGCGSCVPVCPAGAIRLTENGVSVTDRNLCRACGSCASVCPAEGRSFAGKTYEVRELVRLLERDRMFYEQSGGGVTLSGGEALAQDMDYLEALAKQLWEHDIRVNVDTCGHVPYAHLKRMLPWTDVFLYDVKHMDPVLHRKYTGTGNELILENLSRLSADGARISIRLPLVAGVNDGAEEICAVISFLQAHRIRPVSIHLLKYHDTGRGKYAQLGRGYPGEAFSAPDDRCLEQILQAFEQGGFSNVKIGG